MTICVSVQRSSPDRKRVELYEEYIKEAPKQLNWIRTAISQSGWTNVEAIEKSIAEASEDSTSEAIGNSIAEVTD